VSLPAGFGVLSGGPVAMAGAPKKAPKRSGGDKGKVAASGDSLTSPMQGTIVKIAVQEGAVVAAGETIVVLEAMKMEQPLAAHKGGTVTSLKAEVGQTVTSGAVICEIKDIEE
jgi:acetyl-CoA/propionyl-CoA carboxylase biotin carboxyl carrier protein